MAGVCPAGRRLEGRKHSCIGRHESARFIIEMAGPLAGEADAAAPPDKELARRSSAPLVGMVGGTSSEAGDPATSMMTKTGASRLMQEFLRPPGQCPRRQSLRRPAKTINDPWGKIGRDRLPRCSCRRPSQPVERWICALRPWPAAPTTLRSSCAAGCERAERARRCSGPPRRGAAASALSAGEPATSMTTRAGSSGRCS